MVIKVEHILQEAYGFYNRSAKRQRRLKELAENSRQMSVEEKAIEKLETAIEEGLKQGSIC